jgi:hypothetical protein
MGYYSIPQARKKITIRIRACARGARARQRLYAGVTMLGAHPVFQYKIHVV